MQGMFWAQQQVSQRFKEKTLLLVWKWSLVSSTCISFLLQSNQNTNNLTICTSRFKNVNLDWDSLQLHTLTSDWTHGKLLLLLLLLQIIIIVIIMQSNLISGSQYLQGTEFTCSCINAGRCSPLSLHQYVLCVLVWNSYVRRCMPAAEQTFAPDYWHILLNVMLEHGRSIQAQLERAEAPPSGWRTPRHAIPHICSISDCITEALFALSNIRKGYCYHDNHSFIIGIIRCWNPGFYPSKAPSRLLHLTIKHLLDTC